MKINIDLEYAKVIMKYGIYHYEPELRAIYQDILTDALINEKFENISKDKQIVFAGIGAESQQILNTLSNDNKARIAYVFDKLVGSNLSDAKVISIAELKKKNLTDFVIFVLGNQGEEIKAELLPLMQAQSIIDLHDVLARYDILYKDVFKEEKENEYRHITYLDVNNAINYYKQCVDEDKAFFLRRVIAFCLEIRDFIHARKYIEQYI